MKRLTLATVVLILIMCSVVSAEQTVFSAPEVRAELTDAEVAITFSMKSESKCSTRFRISVPSSDGAIGSHQRSIGASKFISTESE